MDSQSQLAPPPQKIRLSDDQTYLLIKEIEARPCLWQKSHHHYTSIFDKCAAITQIALIMDLSETVVKEKLRSLRTIYFKNLQKAKKRKCGNGNGHQPVWRFYNALSFLRLETNTVDVADSLSPQSHFQIKEEPEGSIELSMEYTSNASQSTNSRSSTPTMKKRKTQCDEEQVISWDPIMEPLRPQNYLEQFSTYVTSSLAQIQDDCLVEKTKCQIQLILTKALTEDAQKRLSEFD